MSRICTCPLKLCHVTQISVSPRNKHHMEINLITHYKRFAIEKCGNLSHRHLIVIALEHYWQSRLIHKVICLSVCLSVRPSVRPSVCLSVCLSVCMSVCPSVRPSVRPSVCLSSYLAIRLRAFYCQRKEFMVLYLLLSYTSSVIHTSLGVL